MKGKPLIASAKQHKIIIFPSIPSQDYSASLALKPPNSWSVASGTHLPRICPAPVPHLPPESTDHELHAMNLFANLHLFASLLHEQFLEWMDAMLKDHVL